MLAATPGRLEPAIGLVADEEPLMDVKFELDISGMVLIGLKTGASADIFEALGGGEAGMVCEALRLGGGDDEAEAMITITMD
jgi:hypothetical protein